MAINPFVMPTGKIPSKKKSNSKETPVESIALKEKQLPSVFPFFPKEPSPWGEDDCAFDPLEYVQFDIVNVTVEENSLNLCDDAIIEVIFYI